MIGLGTLINTAAVVVGGILGLLLKKGTEQQVTLTAEVAPDLEAPVVRGQTVGVWRLTLEGETLAEIPIRAAADAPAVTLRWAYGLLLDALLA